MMDHSVTCLAVPLDGEPEGQCTCDVGPSIDLVRAACFAADSGDLVVLRAAVQKYREATAAIDPAMPPEPER